MTQVNIYMFLFRFVDDDANVAHKSIRILKLQGPSCIWEMLHCYWIFLCYIILSQVRRQFIYIFLYPAFNMNFKTSFQYVILGAYQNNMPTWAEEHHKSTTRIKQFIQEFSATYKGLLMRKIHPLKD